MSEQKKKTNAEKERGKISKITKELKDEVNVERRTKERRKKGGRK